MIIEITLKDNPAIHVGFISDEKKILQAPERFAFLKGKSLKLFKLWAIKESSSYTEYAG